VCELGRAKVRGTVQRRSPSPKSLHLCSKGGIMKTLPVGLVVLLSLGLSAAASQESRKAAWTPKEGFVPDAATAAAIAEAVWLPIYGESEIKEQRPYRARLKAGVWIVEGTFNHPPSWSGGVAYAEISKRTGQILKVTHGK